jgi:hypothetical protein
MFLMLIVIQVLEVHWLRLIIEFIELKVVASTNFWVCQSISNRSVLAGAAFHKDRYFINMQQAVFLIGILIETAVLLLTVLKPLHLIAFHAFTHYMWIDFVIIIFK